MRIFAVMMFLALLAITIPNGNAAASFHGDEMLMLFSADTEDGQIAQSEMDSTHDMDGGESSTMPMEGMTMGGLMRPDMAPPAGVMGGMAPSEDRFMGSLSYMRMLMGGNRDGTDDVSAADVLADFPVTPLNMQMGMLMASGMYGVTEDFSVMAMVPYLWLEMDHTNRNGVDFKTRAEGVGDIVFSSAYDLYEGDVNSLQVLAGFSLPTGSINQRDDTPAGNDQVLPYPMQLGSGTVDAMPALHYAGFASGWSWGAHLGARLRLGRNSQDYSLGDRYDAGVWGSRLWSDSLSTSLMLSAETIGDIDGQDSRLNAATVPTADPDLRAGTFVMLALGVNYIVQDGPLSGVRFGLEGQLPVHQNLDGPQLERDYAFSFSVGRAF